MCIQEPIATVSPFGDMLILDNKFMDDGQFVVLMVI